MKVGASLPTLLVLHLVLLFLASASASPLDATFNDHIIIIGAGMAGISAAKKLAEEQFPNFTILEATDRIGGRIRTVEFGGHTIDLGASWIHGSGGDQVNPLFRMAQQKKVKYVYSDYSNVSSNTYKQEGGLYSKDEVEAALSSAQYTQGVGETYSDALGSTDDMTLLALKRLLKREPKTPVERMIDMYFYDRKQAQNSELASLKHTLPRGQFEFYGENEYYVSDPRGYEAILEIFAKYSLKYNDNNVLDDPRIKFNQLVTEIEYSKREAIVRTEDGNEYKARSVIVATGLGVLQSKLIKFIPDLPLKNQRAIAEFGIGLYTKVFFKFPVKFWPTGPGTEFFFYVHNERLGYYAIWQHLENVKPGSNILMLTVVNEEAHRIELQSDEQTKAEAMEVLKKMFGDGIPEPEDILVGRWRTDKLTRGSFTYWPVGYSQEKYEDLLEPLENSVYFGGEYADRDLFGYATGAYYGGANAARGIIFCIKRGRCTRIRGTRDGLKEAFGLQSAAAY